MNRARSSSLNPGSFNGGTYTSAIGGGGTEAPIVVKAIDQDRWFLWVDSFSPVNGKFIAFQSTNVANNAWTAMNRRDYNQPLSSKHTGITPITATEMSNLIARWGSPGWNRLKSYNFPDRYVRHANNVARIDVYPFDPYQDGFADSSWTSFRSYNYPTRYVRHSNHVLRIDPISSSSSTTDRQDATFKITF